MTDNNSKLTANQQQESGQGQEPQETQEQKIYITNSTSTSIDADGNSSNVQQTETNHSGLAEQDLYKRDYTADDTFVSTIGADTNGDGIQDRVFVYKNQYIKHLLNSKRLVEEFFLTVCQKDADLKIAAVINKSPTMPLDASGNTIGTMNFNMSWGNSANVNLGSSINDGVNASVSSTEDYVGVSNFVRQTVASAKDHVFVVTVQNATEDSPGQYYLNDIESSTTIALIEGVRYTFNLNDESNNGYPLKFRLSDNSEYTNGVTTNPMGKNESNEDNYLQSFGSTQTRSITIVAPSPKDVTELYYYSPEDSTMGGKLKIITQSGSNGEFNTLSLSSKELVAADGNGNANGSQGQSTAESEYMNMGYSCTMSMFAQAFTGGGPFDSMDLNKDGVLNRNEYDGVAKSTDLKDVSFQDMDTNQDGTLTSEEFDSYKTQAQQQSGNSGGQDGNE